MVYTRSNILHIVSIVSRYIGYLEKNMLVGCEMDTRYLRGSIDVGLVYHSSRPPNSITNYVEFDYVNDLDKR